MAKVALLIGVSEYKHGLNPLPSALKDVEAMQRVLANPEIAIALSYSSFQVIKLYADLRQVNFSPASLARLEEKRGERLLISPLTL